MSIELKVKIKSLASEAQYIRKEEIKAKKCVRWLAENRTGSNTPDSFDNEALRESLHSHRIFTVRPAARTTQLAYAYLRGKTYLATEQCKEGNEPNQKEVLRLVRKYGNKAHVDSADTTAWFKAKPPKETAKQTGEGNANQPTEEAH